MSGYCGYCNGSGKSFRIIGRISIADGVCVFCNGTGEEAPVIAEKNTYQDTPGKGFTPICPACNGTGEKPRTEMPCDVCKGTGIDTGGD